ncbi:Adenylate cyclase, class 3 [Chitinophaga sp. CF118]|uniref:adenylate/guanylate cyclase domain-containing protein n=1 Tax=Chitinophaga sp. CF118 TaxID=1884367 RepID=UPI0008DF3A11|nr:adenylate/guanylate cyclase domain-containing protein [Chitinophaga sp. CF118]SFD08636.1 Adenylate cyclase, class 3 [Chitinophaga sp. CF118]
MIALHTIPDFLETEIFLSVLLYLLLFSILLNMFITVYEYLGAQAIVGALSGRYSKPAEEDLTFLFIDLRSSTTLAERMGHIQYSLFIENSFQILTDSIYKYNATIYQFVGDEAVLLWPSKNARKTLAPIHFYFDFIEQLQRNGPRFITEFGEVPHFKAAIHSGLVTVTEIRTVKKDIVYHGDVLNTCARIMGQCSSLNKDILISSVVASWLQDTHGFKANLTIELPLRGKVELTAIYELTPVFF